MDPEKLLAEVTAAVDAVAKDMKGLLDKRDLELKSLGTTTSQTAAGIAAHDKLLNDLSEEHKAAMLKVAEMEKKSNRLGGGRSNAEPESIGDMFVGSDAYKDMIRGGERKSKDFNVPAGALWGGRRRAKAITQGEAGLLDNTQLGTEPVYMGEYFRIAGIFAPAMRVPRVRDLIPVNQTSTGLIEWIRETGFINNAAVVGSGETKPQSTLKFDAKVSSVKAIAHWLAVTNQMLLDAPAIRSYIDSRLIYGLKLKEDGEILYGDGTGNNLTGICVDGDVLNYKWSDGRPGDTKLDAIRRAMTKSRIGEYPVTGLVLHPTDWEDIELLKDDMGRYIWVNVNAGGVTNIPLMWRVPVIDTTAISQGEFLTGAFSMATALWDREQVSVRVSDSHADFFIKNQQAILVEERIALTTFRPEAFTVGSFDSAPGSGS